MSTFVTSSRSSENPAVAVITIDRPPRNAMSLETYRQLLAALREAGSDKSVRCIILTGAGEKSFVAGGDLSEHAQLDSQRAIERTALIREVFDTVRRHRAPIIAAVNGYALGGGLALMASCDIVIASENAKFSLPEVNVGIMGGTRHLKRLVPDKVVRWMALTGTMVGADYFLRLGAIQEVVPSPELMPAATRMALQISQFSPTAIRLMKEAMNLTEHMPLDEGYHTECLFTSIMKSSPDGREAVQAVLEKRPPIFDL